MARGLSDLQKTILCMAYNRGSIVNTREIYKAMYALTQGNNERVIVTRSFARLSERGLCGLKKSWNSYLKNKVDDWPGACVELMLTSSGKITAESILNNIPMIAEVVPDRRGGSRSR